MKTTRAIVGKKGTIKIPINVRAALDISKDDVVSIDCDEYEEVIVIHKVKICDGCMSDKHIR